MLECIYCKSDNVIMKRFEDASVLCECEDCGKEFWCDRPYSFDGE